MPFSQLDRSKLRIRPLGERKNKVRIERDHVPPDQAPGVSSETFKAVIEETLVRLREARREGRSRVLAFGAHTIKNGLGPVLIRLMEKGWLTHLATNGAGIIHDWEFAFQGESSEDVRANVAQGQFGLWQETGFYTNLALAVGAWEGLGYGESVGSLIEREGLLVPSESELKNAVAAVDHDPEKAAAAADLLGVVRCFRLKPGWLKVAHPYKRFSAQAAAFRLGIPFTGHPMIGHDIIYCHPMNHGAAVGRTALRDFLVFADSIARLDGGVYLSVGSAVMSPMIFEKSLSMAQNLRLQEGRRIERHLMVVVDLAPSTWDWGVFADRPAGTAGLNAGPAGLPIGKNSTRDGEPPADNPAYYLRYCKTFARMGGAMRYLSADNRDFLLALCHGLTG